MASCSNNAAQTGENDDSAKPNDNSENTESNGAESKPFSFNDIEWELYNGVMDGGRYVLLDLNNNSDCVIKEIEFTFSEKKDLTDEQKNNFYDFVIDLFSLDETNADEVRNESIWFTARNPQIIMPHTTETFNCYYYSGSYYLRNEEFLDLVDPDYAEIEYADSEKLYKA